MKILVLLATYNGESFVEEQLNSIINQSSVNVSVLIRDDGGNDGTVDFCKDFAKRHQNVDILDNPDKRLGSANNYFTLLKNVTDDFDFVALADQDDIWNEDKLIRAVEKLQNQEADCYSSDVIAFFPNGKKQYIKKSYPQKKYDYLFESPGPGSTFVMRVDFVKRLSDFLSEHKSDVKNLISHHDWFIYAFARANNCKWVIDDFPSLLYRQHDSNERGANIGLKSSIYRMHNVLFGDGLQQAKCTCDLLKKISGNVLSDIKFSSFGRVKMAFNGFKFRRKTTDAIIFSLLIILSVMTKSLKA